MLVLSRRCDERILIGNDIEVKVLSAHGNRVRLSILCPEDARILRSDVMESEALRPIPTYSLETSRP